MYANKTNQIQTFKLWFDTFFALSFESEDLEQLSQKI